MTKVLRSRIGYHPVSLLAGLFVLFSTWLAGEATAGGTFTNLATYRGIGQPLSAVLGPGPTPGSERYYVSYSYFGSVVDIVAIDPDTGRYQIFNLPDPKIYAAWALTVGPDGKIYIGTVGEARLMRLDPKTGTIIDVGRPSSTETYIWQLTVGTDNKIYGCTYPNAKLIRYDPQTGVMEDLGTMDPERTQQYARTIAASEDGFIYSGIGFGTSYLAAYEIGTGVFRDIFPAAYRQQYGQNPMHVLRGADGKIYAQIYSLGTGNPVGKSPLLSFRVEGLNVIPVTTEEVPPTADNRLRDGRLITNIFDDAIDVYDPLTRSATRRPYGYAGREIAIERLTMGADGMLYGSSKQPLYLFRLDPKSRHITKLGYLGTKTPGGSSGDVYGLLFYNNSLLMTTYASLSPIMTYYPDRPFNPGACPNAIGSGANPCLITFPDAVNSWRPLAIVRGPDDNAYIGSIAGYGIRGGALTVLDPNTQQVKGSYTVIPEQSVVSLTVWQNLVVGATSTAGGNGTTPTTTEARIFLWDPAQNKTVFDMVPIAGATNITDLVTVNGLVYGIAGSPGIANKLFVFDPQQRTIVYQALLRDSVSGQAIVIESGRTYNSIAIGPGGRLYGLYSQGIFSIEPDTYRARIEAKFTQGGVQKIPEAGFVLSDRSLYFASGATVTQYTIAWSRSYISIYNAVGRVGQTVTLQARLWCPDDNSPINGRRLTFHIDGATIGTAITDANGIARIRYAITESSGSGTRAVTVKFAGDDLYYATHRTAPVLTVLAPAPGSRSASFPVNTRVASALFLR